MFTSGAEERQHLELLLKVARRYYLDGVDQAQIAEEVSFSRATVSRLLAEARRRQIVRFEVGHPLERVLRMEKQLVNRFGLAAARVADVSRGADLLTAVGGCAADLVREIVDRTSVIAVSNGRAVSAVVANLPRLHLPDTCVVQMIGALGQSTSLTDSPDIARRAAEAFGGTYRLMPAPLVVAHTSLARALRREDSIATALALGSRADIALVGVGATTSRGSGDIFSGLLTQRESRELIARGAVGHLLGHHFTARGQHIVDGVCERIMAVPIERTKNISQVIGVACGAEKIAAVRGALAGHFLDVLVTDISVASALLSKDDRSGRG